MKKIKPLIPYAVGSALITSLAASPAAFAEDGDIKFAGFASYVYAKTTSDAEEGDLNDISAEGSERDFNKFGLRMDADLKDGLNFTGQLVAKGTNDYQPDVDWMFATMELQPGLSVSVGKMRLPLFQYSSYLDVGYAYQWITPPQSIYGGGFDSLDGIKVVYSSDIGEWSSEVQVWAGNTEEEGLLIDNSRGIAWQMDRDWLSLRAVIGDGYATSSTANAGMDELIGGMVYLETVTSGAIDLSAAKLGVNDLKMERAKGLFTGVAAFMDFGTYFIGTEATSIDVDDTFLVGDEISYFLTVGARLGQGWALSLTVERDDNEPKDEERDVYEQVLADYSSATTPFLGSDPALDAGINGLGQGLAGVQAQSENEADTYTLTARWDFHPQAAFKAEYITKDSEDITGTYEPTAVRFGLDLIF